MVAIVFLYEQLCLLQSSGSGFALPQQCLLAPTGTHAQALPFSLQSSGGMRENLMVPRQKMSCQGVDMLVSGKEATRKNRIKLRLPEHRASS